jgi:hypothetical protein
MKALSPVRRILGCVEGSRSASNGTIHEYLLEVM